MPNMDSLSLSQAQWVSWSWKKIIVSLITLSGIIFGIQTISSFEPGSSLFSYHPTFMILGQLIAIEGIITFRFLPIKWRITCHWIMSGTAALCFAIGFSAIFQNKINNNKFHFTSWHGLIGITTLGLLCSQVFFGVILKYGYPYLKGNIKYLRFGHHLNGSICLLLTFITVSLVLENTLVYFITIVFPVSIYIGNHLVQSKILGSK